MHRPSRPNLKRSRPRLWCAIGLALLVLCGHALLLRAAMQAPSAAPRVSAIEVRRLLLPAAVPALPPVAVPSVEAPVVRQQARVARRPPALTPPVAPPVEALPATPAVVLAPTRIPASAELVFALQRGAEIGEARLSWQADGERYALALHAMLPSGRELEQHSQGQFDAAGIAPVRLADRKRGRDVRAANFQREHGKITFSGPRWELPLEAGTQDRLSWLLQLVALAEGARDGLRVGTELAMWVVGARGAASHWRFEVRGIERVAHEGHGRDTWWLVREPAHPYDMRIEVWLDAATAHWPLKLRQTQIPGGEPLEWVLLQRPMPHPGT
jgi:hypothetical protein